MRKWVHTTDIAACQHKIGTAAIFYRPLDRIKTCVRNQSEPELSSLWQPARFRRSSCRR